MGIMASLMDYYQASGPSGAFTQAGINQQAGEVSEDAGLAQTLMKRQFESRTLPDLINNQASRGAFHSSATSNALNRATEDYTGESADVSRLLQRELAGLSRNRILAGLGVAI